MRRERKKREYRSTLVKIDAGISREKILRVAVEIAQRGSLLDVMLLPVAREAKVSHSLILYYFGGISQLKKEVQECLEKQ